MNNKRRKALKDIANKINEYLDKVNELKAEEEDYYDNIPENLIDSDRASDSEEAIDLLDNIVDSMEDIINDLKSF